MSYIKTKGKYLWLLDNGHGGIRAGQYATNGKRSPELSGGRVLYEGEFNRAIVNRIVELLESEGLIYERITPEDDDIPLVNRVQRVNRIWDAYRPKPILISVHANAGGGKGFEVFTSRGETKSDKLATLFIKNLETEFPGYPIRKDWRDGDADKEANFRVLIDTKCPAILTENLFMDNPQEAEHLLNPSVRDRIARAHVNFIKTVERTNPY